MGVQFPSGVFFTECWLPQVWFSGRDENGMVTGMDEGNPVKNAINEKLLATLYFPSIPLSFHIEFMLKLPCATRY